MMKMGSSVGLVWCGLGCADDKSGFIVMMKVAVWLVELVV